MQATGKKVVLTGEAIGGDYFLEKALDNHYLISYIKYMPEKQINQLELTAMTTATATTALKAADLKDLTNRLLYTRNDIGVGPAELKGWCIRAERVHAEITQAIEVGTSKQNAALMAKLVGFLEALASQIDQAKQYVLDAETEAAELEQLLDELTGEPAKEVTAEPVNNIDELQEGDKITYVLENTWGFNVVRHARFNRVEVKQGRFYGENSLALYSTLKGERKVRGTSLKGVKVTIGRGWQDIEQPAIEGDCFDGVSYAKLAAMVGDVVFAA